MKIGPIIFIAQIVTDELEYQFKNGETKEVKARAWLFQKQLQESQNRSRVYIQDVNEHLYIRDHYKPRNNDAEILFSAEFRLRCNSNQVTVYSNDGFMSIRADHHNLIFEKPTVSISHFYAKNR